MVLDTVFIVPYRDREPHKAAFLEAMASNLADWSRDSYRILFVHQCDMRPFNRGAMKNIGFLAVKKLYPLTYRNITLIFHDVDTWPASKDLITYHTRPGIVSHFYGYTFALGGMVAIKGQDFEHSGGFPNLWGWGIEDNTLQDRCLSIGLTIDRSNFYKIDDPRIMRMFDGVTRLVSTRDPGEYKKGRLDSLYNLRNVDYEIDGEMVNVTQFTTGTRPEDQQYSEYDIRHGNKLPIINESISNTIANKRDWHMDFK